MRLRFILLVCLLLTSANLRADDSFSISNQSSFETRHFVDNRDQHPINHAETFETLFILDYKKNGFHALLKPRLAIDLANFDRNRYIPNEAFVEFFSDKTSLKAGLQIETWGHAPFYNPLNVLNRSDLEFDFYNPPQLGELMVSLDHHFSDSSQIKLYGLPLFQATPLPELNTRFDFEGRAGFVPYSLDDQIQTSSNAREIAGGLQWHQDFKLFNFDLYYFHGPEKTPGFVLRIDNQGALRLRPFYYTIDMIGASFEKSVESWIFRLDLAGKLTNGNDAVSHSVPFEDGNALPHSYFQYVPSLEKSWQDLIGHLELTLLAAYYGDSEGSSLRNFRPFQNDAFAGVRVSFNDPHQNQAELGLVKDLGNSELALMAEWQMRLYREFKLSVGGIFVHQSSGLNTPISFFDNNTQVYSKISTSF